MMHKDAIEDCEHLIRMFLSGLGEDIQREGLKETPKRYVKFYDEFLSPKKFEMTTFTEKVDEMILVKDIPFYSLCEHHLAPFFGIAHIAYLPSKGKICGISKIPRTLDMFARRLQNQERITNQVANFMMDALSPLGVGVCLEARHLCMEMRGIQKPGAITSTCALLGVFKEGPARAEFLQLIKK